MFHLEKQLAYPSQITNSIFLGNVDSLSNRKVFTKLGVTHVLSIMKNAPSLESNDQVESQLIIALEDSAETDIYSHFEKAFDFIQKALDDNKKILIHCEKGISRSASFVIAWLMYQEHNNNRIVSLETTLSYVKNIRGIVAPNSGFIDQLMKLQDQLNSQLNSPKTQARKNSFFTPNSLSFNLKSNEQPLIPNELNILIPYIPYKDLSTLYFKLKSYNFSNISIPLVMGASENFNLLSEIKDSELFTDALIGSMYTKNEQWMQTILSLDDPSNSNINDWSNVLIHAVRTDSYSFLQAVNTQYQLNWTFLDEHGNNLLFIAAFYGSYESFKFLFEVKHLDPFIRNNAQANLLEPISFSNNQSLIEYVEANLKELDPNQPNNSGLTPLKFAEKHKNDAVLTVFNRWYEQKLTFY